MPVYEYECLACGKQFEKLVFNSNTQVVCPYCNQEKVQKKFSLFSSPGGNKSSALGSSGGSSCSSCTSQNCGSCH